MIANDERNRELQIHKEDLNSLKFYINSFVKGQENLQVMLSGTNNRLQNIEDLLNKLTI